MEQKTKKIVEEFVRRIKEKYGEKIEEAILFGSYARGDYTGGSDIDIIVITDKEDFRLRRDIIGMTSDIFLKEKFDISVKVISRGDFEEHRGAGFIKNVLREGEVLA